MRKIIFILLFVSAFAKAQDNYIVLDQTQKEFLDTFRIKYNDTLAMNHVDFMPIKIKNSLYILPTKILSDPAFRCVYLGLQARGSFERMIIRWVEEDEFIEYDINGNIIE